MHLVENESQIRKYLTTYRPSWPQLTRFDVLAAYTIFVYSGSFNGASESLQMPQRRRRHRYYQGSVLSGGKILRQRKPQQCCKQGNLDLFGRHCSRYALFNPLVHDFASDLSTIQASTIQIVDNKSGMTKLSLPDDSVWENFCAKWLIPKGLDFSSVFGLAQPFFDDNGALAEPKFQELCLLDLPNELLDLCFRECDVSDARALSATCKHLKAVSLPCIYVARSLGVLPANLTSLQRDIFKSSSTEPKDSSSFHQALVRCVATLEFLLGRADITDRLRRVRLFDYYWCQGEDECIPVYNSIRSMLCNVLQHCPNLTTLKARGFGIGEQFVDAISTLSALHTIFPHDCTFSYFMDSHLPYYPYSLPQLRNSSLSFFTNEDEEQCIYHPDSPTLPTSTIFSIYGFKEWLVVLGSSTTSHPLSHVKVGLAHPQSDMDILHLVDVLDQYSIRSLYLDGLLEGRPELISGIAERLSGLEALTLLCRTGRRERWLRSWPEPVWEYASHFSNFTNFHSSGWNVLVLFDRVTPKALVPFEGGEHGDSVLPYAGLPSREQDDELSEDDERHRMAIVFSTFIEMLETISFYVSITLARDFKVAKSHLEPKRDYVLVREQELVGPNAKA
ncbi:hypothetical protein IW262DRAFT_1496827 [Armillaria fumosa]|nr:hypothetical protein IW262DRAFT_1496827 [Armillaria fumosa]